MPMPMSESHGFMVYIQGKSGPSKIHKDVSDAEAEAVRLSSRNPESVIYVLGIVGILDPVKRPTHEWRTK